ncbi:MAG TPA: hypothetical protein VIF14_05165 [Alphaproteobacteria bacterium]
MRFASPDEAIAAVNRAFGPIGNVFWRFDRPLRHVDNPAGAAASVKSFQAATMQTMHFGLVTIDLASGETRFVDEDHRDGGDFELKRVILPGEWLAALRALAWPD